MSWYGASDSPFHAAVIVRSPTGAHPDAMYRVGSRSSCVASSSQPEGKSMFVQYARVRRVHDIFSASTSVGCPNPLHASSQSSGKWSNHEFSARNRHPLLCLRTQSKMRIFTLNNRPVGPPNPGPGVPLRPCLSGSIRALDRSLHGEPPTTRWRGPKSMICCSVILSTSLGNVRDMPAKPGVGGLRYAAIRVAPIPSLSLSTASYLSTGIPTCWRLCATHPMPSNRARTLIPTLSSSPA